jgi:hypothetical protein
MKPEKSKSTENKDNEVAIAKNKKRRKMIDDDILDLNVDTLVKVNKKVKNKNNNKNISVIMMEIDGENLNS